MTDKSKLTTPTSPYVREKKSDKCIFVLPMDLRKRMRFICFKRDILMSQFIREAIEELVKRYEKLMG